MGWNLKRLCFVSVMSLALFGCGDGEPEDIFAAIRADNIEAVTLELGKLEDLEPVCPATRNCKPLGYAAAFGNIEIVKLLIEAGADPNGIGAYGDVPLIKAANSGEMANRTPAEIFKLQSYLLEHGADPNIPNRYGLSPFTGFCMYGEFAKMELALKYGADVNGAYETRRIARPPTMASVLMHTVSRKQAEAVVWLIDHGADVTYENREGETALSWARDGEMTEIIAILEAAGAQ